MLFWLIIILILLIGFGVIYLNLTPSMWLYYDLKTHATAYKNTDLSKLYIGGDLPTLNTFDIQSSVNRNAILYYLAKNPKVTNTCYITDLLKRAPVNANPTSISELSTIVYSSVLSNRVNSAKISLKCVRDYFQQNALVPQVDLNDLIELYRWKTLKINVGQNSYYNTLVDMIGEGAVTLNFDLYARLIYRLSRNVRPFPTLSTSIDSLESNKLEPITLSPRNVPAQTNANSIAWDGLEFYTGTKHLYFPGIKRENNLVFTAPVVKVRGSTLFHVHEGEYLLARINRSLVYIGKSLNFATPGVIQSNVENSGAVSKTIVLNLNIENGTASRKINYMFAKEISTIAVSEWVSYKFNTMLHEVSVEKINATELSISPVDPQKCIIVVLGDSIPTITKDKSENIILDGTTINKTTFLPEI